MKPLDQWTDEDVEALRALSMQRDDPVGVYISRHVHAIGALLTMHTGPIPESEGDFQPHDDKLYDCPHCGGKHCVECDVWESSCGGYEDYKHTCRQCGKVWWIDGPDS